MKSEHVDPQSIAEPGAGYLNALVRIGHHSDEQVDQNDHRNQHVHAIDDFEQNFGPVWLVIVVSGVITGYFELVGARLAEHGKKEQLESADRVLLDWNRKVTIISDRPIS